MPSLEDHFRALTRVRPPDSSLELRELDRAPAPPRRHHRTGVAALAFLIAAAGFVFAIRAFQTEQGAPTAFPSVGNGLIAFSRGGPESGLYVTNPDGTGITRLPSEPGDTDAAWSPDGTKIAFEGFHAGKAGIYVMNADGTNVQQITDGGSDGGPAWSPDGTRIAFAREAREEGAKVANADIYVVNADGTGLVRLTHDPVMEYTPAWSPDGSRIAFVGYDEASGGQPPSRVRLYVMTQDGTDIRTIGPADVAEPTWSPDGLEISYVDTETGSIMAIQPDGTGQRRVIDVAQLVGGVHLVGSPTWSPDGTKIAFDAGPDAGDTHLYVVNRDGSGFSQLTQGPASDAEPAWQPVPTEQVSPSPSGPPSSPAPSAEVGQRIEVGQASAVLYADGSVWVDVLRDARTSTGTVLRIDERSGEILARIPVDAFPDSESGGGGMAYDGRFVWIVGTSSPVGGSTRGILVRIDPETNEAARFDLNVATAGTDLVFDGQDLWTTATSSPGKPLVLQIDPGSGRIIAEIPFEAEWWGSLVVVDGAIWVTEMSVKNYTVQGDLTLVRLDPATGADITRVPFGTVYGLPASTSPVAGGGAIWAGAGDRLLRIDPQTGEVTAQIPASIGLDLEYADDGSIWFLRTWDALQRLDPTTGKIDVTVQLDRKPIPVAVAVGPGAVWVLDYDGGLTRRDLT